MLPLPHLETPPSNRPQATFLVHFAAFVIVIAGIKAAQEIVLLILVSVIAAVALAPPVFFLKEKGWPFPAALSVVMAAVVGLMAVSAGLVGASMNDFGKQLPIYQRRVRQVTVELSEWLGSFGLDLPVLDQLENLEGLVDPGEAMSLAASLFAGLGGVLANGFLILIMVVFLLLEASSFEAKLEAAFGDRGRAIRRFREMGKSVNQYLAIKTWISLLTGVLAALICWIAGVDFALLWGVLAFLLNYIPNIGSILAAVPPVMLAIVQTGVIEAMLVAVGYVLLNNILGNMIEPRVMGKGLGLSTFVVVLSLLFWGWVLGPVGMLLSVPLTMAVKIAMQDNLTTNWAAVLLGSGAEAEAHVAAARDASSANKEPLRHSGAA